MDTLKSINKKIICKYINWIILFVGVILVLTGYLWNPQKTVENTVVINTDLKNLFMNIGCSIIASVIIAFLTQKYLERKDLIYEMIDEWQLEKIYSTREEANTLSIEKKIENLNSNLDIIAFGLDSFRNSKSKLLIKKLQKKNDIQIRIITLNPNSIFVDEREKIENKAKGSIKKSIQDLSKWVDEINKVSKSKIQIKYYDSLPLDSYMKIDGKIYIGPYEYGKMSSQSITYEFEDGGKGFNYYNSYFDDLWTSDKLCFNNISDFGEKVVFCESPNNKNICNKLCGDGLVDYYTSYTDINNTEVKEHIKGAKIVKFVEIYSSRNVKEYYNELKEMAINNNGKLIISIVNVSDPNSNAYKYLNNKFSIGNNINKDKHNSKIDNSELINELKRLQSDIGRDDAIKICYSDYIPQYSAMIIDDIAYVILYQTSPGRNTNIPAFKIQKQKQSKFYDFITKDFENIVKQSEEAKIEELV